MEDLSSLFNEVADLEKSIKRSLSDLDASHILLASQLDGYRHQMEIRDPPMDEALTLFEAVCLPELGGMLLANGNNVQAVNLTVENLRREIKAGRLRRVPPFNANHYVSRKTIKEWLECRVEEAPQNFISSQSAKTKTVASRERSTASNILTKTQAVRNISAQDLARAKAEKLKAILQNG
ncbi:MAG: hypothetical protein ACJLUP_16655 [Agrobacterium tumefaciens]